MQAGQLKDIIDIWRLQKSRNKYGEEVEVYRKVSSTRARIEHSTGSREIQAEEKVYSYRKTLHIHYYVDLKETDRIAIPFTSLTKRYRILSIEPVHEWNEKIVVIEEINE